MQQANNEVHPRRLACGSLPFRCYRLGGSFWLPQCCQNSQHVQSAQLARTCSSYTVRSTGKYTFCQHLFEIIIRKKHYFPEFLFQVVENFQHFLVAWTALSHGGYQSWWVKYHKLFLPLSLNEQLVLGVGLYLIPFTPVCWRAACMPIHVYSGLLLFTSVIAVALMGITEKLIFGL